MKYEPTEKGHGKKHEMAETKKMEKAEHVKPSVAKKVIKLEHKLLKKGVSEKTAHKVLTKKK
jgi:hypothetical protein